MSYAVKGEFSVPPTPPGNSTESTSLPLSRFVKIPNLVSASFFPPLLATNVNLPAF